MRPSREIIDERHAALRLGLSYEDWRAMTRWQVRLYVEKCMRDRKERVDEAKKGFKQLLGQLIARLLLD